MSKQPFFTANLPTFALTEASVSVLPALGSLQHTLLNAFKLAGAFDRTPVLPGALFNLQSASPMIALRP